MLMKFAANMVMRFGAIDEPRLDCDDRGRQTEGLWLGGLAFLTPCLVMGRAPAAGVPRYVLTRPAWYISGQPKALTPTYPFFGTI